MSKISKDNNRLKIHSVRYNLLMNIILKVSAVLFPLITFPYTTRTLGAEAYGRAGFAISVVNYFALIASLGIPSYAVRKCAQKRDDPAELAKTVKEILAINLVSLIITYLVFVICIIHVPKLREDRTIMMINSLSIILQAIGVEWFYQSIEQYDYITVRNIIVRVISILLLFIFVRDSGDIIPYSIIAITGTVGSNLLNFIRLPRIVNLKVKCKLDWRQHLKPIFVLFFYYAATTIYTNLDVVMLGFLTENSVVGFYNASVKLKNILVSLITALGVVSLPRASYYLSNGDKDKFKGLIRTSLNLVLLLSISLAIFFTLEAKPIVLLLAGEGYTEAIRSMMWITPSIIFIGIGSITAWQLLIPLGRDKCTLIGAIVGALVDFAINWLLIPEFGATGASIGTLCAEICVVIVHLIGLRDIIKEYIDTSNILKIFGGAIVGLAILYTFNRYVDFDSNFAACVASAALFFSIFGIMELSMREKTTLMGISYIRKNLKIKR